jgi:uncharacterized membrane protein YsdA (DUF1294 family)
MEYYWTWIYLGIINLVSVFIFIADRKAARRKRFRVPERILHLLEFMGGVFSIFIFMYILPHKNRKASYFMWTWLIFVWWSIILVITNIDFMSWTLFTKKH